VSQQYPNPENQPQWGAQQPQQFPPQGQPPQYGQQPPQPGQPGQPNYQAPPQYQAIPPNQLPPRKSWFGRHKVLTTVGVVFAFAVVIGIASGGGGTDKPASDTAASAPAGAGDKAKPAGKVPAKKLSQADQFKAFVAKNGTANEKSAVGHVIKVQGADEQNNVLDAADVYTDFTGGIIGPHANDAKLLASAFADWKDSDNGLVTIYDKAGEIMSNGQF
jgi:hypothetical protein